MKAKTAFHPRCHRARNPVDRETQQHKQKNINDIQWPSGDKRFRGSKYRWEPSAAGLNSHQWNHRDTQTLSG